MNADCKMNASIAKCLSRQSSGSRSLRLAVLPGAKRHVFRPQDWRLFGRVQQLKEEDVGGSIQGVLHLGWGSMSNFHDAPKAGNAEA